MANWISSKLKVAETFLQQIDQQAAESLGKNDEKPRSDELNLKTLTKTDLSVIPLKDQLKKRATLESNDFYSPLVDKSKELGTPSKPPLNPSPLMPTLTDSDWTKLLSTPDQQTSPSKNHTNGISPKDAKKLLELKKNKRSPVSVSKSTRKSNIASESRVNGGGAFNRKLSDGEESGSGDSARKSNVELLNDDGHIQRIEKLGVEESVPQSGDANPILGITPVSVKVDGIAEIKKQVDGNRDGFRVDESDAAARSSSLSTDGSASDTDSTSTSDSEKERERKAERARRREHIMAEKAAAKAVEAINEHENIVARLEGEKQSLEKILEERARQQAQEASELQMSMMETMDAVDLEKQKHNNTRMEAFARLTKLETTNADFAKSLANIQWNLEIEVNQVAELRQQIELKEAAQEELRRRISKIHQSGSSPDQLEASKGVEFEREILEAEYSLICDKIGQLQEKEKELEGHIEIMRKEMEVPTEVEVELKRRLAQLTNHLIQKQAQVEALSSEKATLLFRIETVSRLIEEQKLAPQLLDLTGPSSREDLEAGTWEVYNSKGRPLFPYNIQSGGQRLGSLVRQLDAIFSEGAAFLRRNPSAKILSLVYLVLLHFWVSYILMSHSQVSDTRSGAVISLESINKTIGP